MLRHRGYDRRQGWLGAQAVFLRDLAAQLIEVDIFFWHRGIFLRLKFLNEGVCYV